MKKKLALLLAVLLALGGLAAILIWDRADKAREQERLSSAEDGLPRFKVNLNGAWYQLRDKIDTYLIIGVDKESDRLENLDPDAQLNDLQSDFLLLAVADREAGTLTAVQLNRDSMAEIPRIGRQGARLSPVTQQLALAHTYGSGGRDSCANTVKAVSGFLYGLPIEHYFSVTMDAVPVLTDLVDGVPVPVVDDFTANREDFPLGSTVTLRGDQALTYVRSRYSVADGSNLNRMNRQRLYLESLQDRLRAKFAESDSFPLKLANALAPYTVSDLITEELAREADRLNDFTFEGIETIPGKAEKGEVYIEFYPEEEALQELLVRLLFEPAPSV